jgi:uncharacterized phiE125 gp8 family phage protein
MSAITLVTAPATPAVSIEEAKVYVRLAGDDGSHNALLANLVGAATSVVERKTGLALITRTYALQLDGFPGGADPVIYLPKPPALAVSLVRYLDDAGSWITLDAALYTADVASVPGRVAPAPDTAWPGTRRMLGAVQVTYTAGYGPAASDVPEDLRLAILMLAGHWYDNPTAASSMSLSEVPMAFAAILEQHAMPRV